MNKRNLLFSIGVVAILIGACIWVLKANSNIASSSSRGVYEEITGFYTKYSKEYGYDEVVVGTESCDAFVVLSGDGESVRKLRGMVLSGNTVNKIDDQGRLVFNVDLSDFDDSLRLALISSAETNPVDIKISMKELEGKGALPCHSFVHVRR